MREELIRIWNGKKNVDGYDILSGIQIQIFREEICGLISGEQREMELFWEILQGNVRLDEGTAYFCEKRAAGKEFPGILRANVTVVDGRSHMIYGLSPAENMFLVSGRRLPHLVYMASMERRLEQLYSRFGLQSDALTSVAGMNRLQQYEFELLKAHVQGYRLVLVDLRGNPLSAGELRHLFALIGRLREYGMTFAVWNPILAQLHAFSDRLIILKNGRTARMAEQGELSVQNIRQILLGGIGEAGTSPGILPLQREAFRMEGISDDYLRDVNLQVAAGTIHVIRCETAPGLAHLYGILSGEIAPVRGKMETTHKPYHPSGTAEAIRSGVGLMEDSTFSGMLFRHLSVFDNICLVKGNFVSDIWRKRRFRKSLENRINQWFGREICSARLGELSEAEQQRVLFCRWMLYRPKLLVIANPFVGGCIHMNETSLSCIRDVAGQGTAVLILSASEIPFADFRGNEKYLTADGRLLERGEGA